MRSFFQPLLVVPALLATLAACGNNDDRATSTPQPTTSAPSTPPTTPTPSALPTQTTAKYRDLTLVLNRPATVDPKTEPAVLQFQQVHQLFAVMAGGKAAPPELSETAAPTAVKYLNDILVSDRKAKQHAGGTLTVSATKAQASTSSAVVDGCFDQSKVITIRADGSRFVDPTVTENPTFLVRVTLSRSTGTWKISEYVLSDGRC